MIFGLLLAMIKLHEIYGAPGHPTIMKNRSLMTKEDHLLTMAHILAGWWLSPTPLINRKVNWDDDIPNIWENNIMFQTTNQLGLSENWCFLLLSIG